MSRSIEREMGETALGIWKRLDPAMQATMRRTVETVRRYESGVSYETALVVLERQTIPSEQTIPVEFSEEERLKHDNIVQAQRPMRISNPRCAATGLIFNPGGLLRPFLFMVDPDQGFVADNLVLVCHGYYLLRKSTRTGGKEGHRRVMQWIRDFGDIPEDIDFPINFKELDDVAAE